MLGKILIVDDEEDFLSSMRDILISAGYEVVVAGNGTKALHLLEKERPDVILTDIVMPDLSGLQLARSVRQLKGESIPIITITGYPFRDETLVGVKEEALANFSLTKPLEVPDLLSALSICLAGR